MARTKAETPEEPIAETPGVEASPEAPVEQADPTPTFEALGLPYCKECKQLLQSSYMGHPICPIKKDGCERNQ